MGELKDKVQGKAKEVAGTVTGDDQQQMEGKAQKTWGGVQGTANDLRDTAGTMVEKVRRGDTSDTSDGDVEETASRTT